MLRLRALVHIIHTPSTWHSLHHALFSLLGKSLNNYIIAVSWRAYLTIGTSLRERWGSSPATTIAMDEDANSRSELDIEINADNNNEVLATVNAFPVEHDHKSVDLVEDNPDTDAGAEESGWLIQVNQSHPLRDEQLMLFVSFFQKCALPAAEHLAL